MNNLQISTILKSNIDPFQGNKKMIDMLTGSGFSKVFENNKKMIDMLTGSGISKVFEDNRKMVEAFTGSGISKVFEDNRKMVEAFTGSGISKVFEDNKKMIEAFTGSGISKVFEDNKKMIEAFTGSGISKVFEDNRKMVEAFTGSGISKVFEDNRKMVEAFTKYQDFSSTAGSLDRTSSLFEGYQEFLKSIDPVDKSRLIRIVEDDMLLKQESSEISLSEVFSEFESVSSPEEITNFIKNHPLFAFVLKRLLNFIEALLHNIIIAVYIMPQFNFDYANRQKDQPEKYVTPKTIKQDVKSLSIDRSLLKNLRFVNVEVLKVRAGKSVRSMIIDRLKLGQTLEVLSKNKDWAYVRYQNCDDEILEGWVYKKYIQKFE
jgi:ribosomal protein S17E